MDAGWILWERSYVCHDVVMHVDVIPNRGSPPAGEAGSGARLPAHVGSSRPLAHGVSSRPPSAHGSRPRGGEARRTSAVAPAQRSEAGENKDWGPGLSGPGPFALRAKDLRRNGTISSQDCTRSSTHRWDLGGGTDVDWVFLRRSGSGKNEAHRSHGTGRIKCGRT